jgi:serine/threonine protein kinase
MIRINSGVYYGYSQVGKCITVYPRNEKEAVLLARHLCKLTRGMSAPIIPFDLRVSPDSCVYYRYGAFKLVDIINTDGTRTPAIHDPDGNLVPDLRQTETAKPAWVPELLIKKRPQRKLPPVDCPLKTTYRAFQALSQRGKGGVYKAVDLSGNQPRLCILKEGRGGGEINWDGRDGHWLVRNDERVLKHLQTAGIDVPRVHSSFEIGGNYYLVIELIDGQNLQSWLRTKRRRLTIGQVLGYGLKLSLVVTQIHEAGWVWRDCKPGNLILTREGELRPVDFEGACRVDSPDLFMWSTPEFSPPDSQAAHRARSSTPDDVYSVGAITYFLLTGRMPGVPTPLPIAGLRRNVPYIVSELISTLLNPDPEGRPTARAASERFKETLARVDARSVLDLIPSDDSLPLETGPYRAGLRVSKPAHRTSSANLGSGRRLSITGSINKNGNEG